MTRNREFACNIVELFEDLLDKKNITVVCADKNEETDRYEDNNCARLYGSEFWGLVDEIEYMLDKKENEHEN